MDLQTSLERVVSQLGYELVDFEMSNRGRLLRLFIDKPGGVTVEDCALVSNQVSHYLSVENDVDYDRLEISSPGIDRVLKKEADFIRFNGVRAKIRLSVPVEGKKNYVGVLKGVEDGQVLLECDGTLVRVMLTNIEKARLNPEL
jgi:ribosome maturation factor RimP